MVIRYSGRIERITHHTPGGSSVILRIEPMAEGPMAPYASGAEISSGMVTIKVQWLDVAQGVEFDDLFFEFESF